MTALPNVTIAQGARKASQAEDNLRERLATNRHLLLRNVTATQRLVELCSEHGVITTRQKAAIQVRAGAAPESETLAISPEFSWGLLGNGFCPAALPLSIRLI